MDVRLDEAGNHQASAQPFLARIGQDAGRDVDDAAVPDGDIGERVFASGNARVAQDQKKSAARKERELRRKGDRKQDADA